MEHSPCQYHRQHAYMIFPDKKAVAHKNNGGSNGLPGEVHAVIENGYGDIQPC